MQKDLRGTETEMGKLEKQVQELQKELKKSESELERLDAEKKKLQTARVEQQRLIAIQARAAYQSGRQEYLKLLLNQQNPEKFARTLTYYDYLSKARLAQLKGFNETLRQLANVEQEIADQQSQLLDQKTALDTQRDQLDKVRKERQQALAKLNDDVKARDAKLQAREQDQADLGKVLKTIEETLARQAREAEEARQKALIAQQEAEKSASVRPSWPPPPTRQRRVNRRTQRLAQWFPAAASLLADLLLQPVENFHGLLMVDYWHASVKPVAMTPAPSGMG